MGSSPEPLNPKSCQCWLPASLCMCWVRSPCGLWLMLRQVGWWQREVVPGVHGMAGCPDPQGETTCHACLVYSTRQSVARPGQEAAPGTSPEACGLQHCIGD